MGLINLEARRAYNRAYQRKWAHANLDKKAAYKKAWREKYPEKQAAKARRQRLRRKYGISATDYDRMMAEQNGVCAICNSPPRGEKKVLAVDHNHMTGEVRALLCDKCNTDIGVLESPMFVAYREYLDRYEPG
jgi:hypothetical protein